MDWNAVLKGCPCGTCQAARRAVYAAAPAPTPAGEPFLGRPPEPPAARPPEPTPADDPTADALQGLQARLAAMDARLAAIEARLARGGEEAERAGAEAGPEAHGARPRPPQPDVGGPFRAALQALDDAAGGIEGLLRGLLDGERR